MSAAVLFKGDSCNIIHKVVLPKGGSYNIIHKVSAAVLSKGDNCNIIHKVSAAVLSKGDSCNMYLSLPSSSSASPYFLHPFSECDLPGRPRFNVMFSSPTSILFPNFDAPLSVPKYHTLDSHFCCSYIFLCTHLCQSFPCPRSIAMTAFFLASLFSGSYGLSWCFFTSLLTLSIHMSLKVSSLLV